MHAFKLPTGEKKLKVILLWHGRKFIKICKVLVEGVSRWRGEVGFFGCFIKSKKKFNSNIDNIISKKPVKLD